MPYVRPSVAGALTLANAGNCECPMCRQCWHLPKLKVGDRVRILYKGADTPEAEAVPPGKGVAPRTTTAASTNPPKGRGGPLRPHGGGSSGGGPNEPRTFWQRAMQMLHGRCGHVEAFADGSARRTVSVRLEASLADEIEGTALEVAIVGIPEAYLFSAPACDTARPSDAAAAEWAREMADEAPDEFLDPITMELMAHPVRLPSGFAVERSAIQRMLLAAPIDPFSRQACTMDDLIEDSELSGRIVAWREAHEGRTRTERATSAELQFSPAMADALARPTDYSLDQLEALGLLPSALVQCTACEERLPADAFSNKQLKKPDRKSVV